MNDQTNSSTRGDTSPVEVALLDQTGVIVYVNEAWMDFCLSNGGDPSRVGVGTNYLLSTAAAGNDPTSRTIDLTVRAAIIGELPVAMTIRIPCDSDHAARWFDLAVASRYSDAGQPDGATVTLSRAEPDPSKLTAVRDYQRIVAELDDHVVQDLYAVGLGLQALLRALPDSGYEARIIGSINVLDAVLRRIQLISEALAMTSPIVP